MINLRYTNKNRDRFLTTDHCEEPVLVMFNRELQ